MPQSVLSNPSPSQPTQNPIRVEASPQLFATLCALYAAGYPALPAPTSVALRNLALHMRQLKGPSVDALRKFYQLHRQPTDEATLAGYISFAMVAGPPPDFSFIVPQEGLPPDVRTLDGFQRLLISFYQEQHIDDLWQQVQPDYDAMASRMRGPVSEIVTIATAFTRRIPRFNASGGAAFDVLVDPLIGSATNFRIYSERYVIAISPAAPNAVDQVRHAFLHYLLDWMPFDDRAAVESKQAIMTAAINAPQLPDQYKQDFVAFTDECLVRAVDLQLRHLQPADLAAALDREDGQGYVLVRPLYEGLSGYGASPDDFRTYFLQLMNSIDTDNELARDQKIQFAPADAAQRDQIEAESNQVAQWMDEGNRQIAMGDAKDAVATFERILKQDPGNTPALYRLAVSSAMSGQAERARQLFRQVVTSPPGHGVPDPDALAWSHVYLGRMSDLAGQRQQALAEYHAALSIAGAPPAARIAAQQGVDKPYVVPVKETDPGGQPHR